MRAAVGVVGVLVLALAGCRPPARCTADEEPYCDDPACTPLCADGALREVCTEGVCTFSDGTSTGPTTVICETVEDAPNEIRCGVPGQSPVCACPSSG